MDQPYAVRLLYLVLEPIPSSMKSFFTSHFLGATTQSFESETFKVSVVNYTQRVSEDWHWHERYHLSAIMRGGNLESRKRKDIQVTPGQVMAYDLGEIHRNRFTAHPSSNLNIELDEGFFIQDICFSNFNETSDVNIELYRIYMELLLNDQYSEQTIDQTLKSLFWKGSHEDVSIWILRLEALLNDRWKEFPSLYELSTELEVHPITISKYFAKSRGITLSDYMRKIKVKRALGLLLNSSQTISEIAFSCGFSDQSHMTRLTKHYVGYTPGEIRSQWLG